MIHFFFVVVASQPAAVTRNFLYSCGLQHHNNGVIGVLGRIGQQSLPWLCDAFTTFAIRVTSSLLNAAEAGAAPVAIVITLVLWGMAVVVCAAYLLNKTFSAAESTSHRHAGRWSG